MSHYGEHSIQIDKFRIKIGKPEKVQSTSGYSKSPAQDWITSPNLTIKDINKHPITGK